MEPRRFVYILHSDTDPDRHYVGLTSDVAERLHWHNTGPSGRDCPQPALSAGIERFVHSRDRAG
jgi:hypothetical protein